MRFRVLSGAESEALEAALWYEDRKPGLGDQFLDAYIDALAAIRRDPESFARLETVRSRREYRRCALARFPYVVIYELQQAETTVVAVAHASKRSGYWRNRNP